MMPGRILVTGDFELPPQYVAAHVRHLRIPADVADVVQNLQGVQHYIVGGPEYVDDATMASAPELEQVVVMGTGTNSFIDVNAARRRGIRVDNTPGINADAVAEFALGSIIVHLANGVSSRDSLLAGVWQQKPHRTLGEVRIGIVGLGNIGSRLAAKLRAVAPACELSYFSRTRKGAMEASHGLRFLSLGELVESSDLLVLCVTYSAEAPALIDSETMRHVKEGAMLFNFSNPRTVDPEALRQHLVSGKMGFAYFDGYYDEWIANRGEPFDRFGLLGLGPDRFVATSHIAAQAHGVIERILHEAFAKVARSPSAAGLASSSG